MRDRLLLVGAVAWTLQPLYVLVELVVSTRASADYRLVDSTVSDLGVTSCRTIRGDVLCSDWHSGMNLAFVWFGCTLALGALLLGGRLLGGRTGTASVVLWVVSALGSVGVGLVPVNEDGGLHGLVATPIFLAQPLALLLMGLSRRATEPGWARATVAVAGLSGLGSLVFFALVLTDSASAVGAFERLALWPGYVWVGVTAVRSGVLRR